MSPDEKIAAHLNDALRSIAAARRIAATHFPEAERHMAPMSAQVDIWTKPGGFLEALKGKRNG